MMGDATILKLQDNEKTPNSATVGPRRVCQRGILGASPSKCEFRRQKLSPIERADPAPPP